MAIAPVLARALGPNFRAGREPLWPSIITFAALGQAGHTWLEAAGSAGEQHHVTRLAISLPTCDPQAVAWELAGPDSIPWCWQPHTARPEVFAVGELTGHKLPDAGPAKAAFSAVGHWAQRVLLLDGAPNNLEEVLPLAWLATSFDAPQGRASGPWGSLGGGQVVLPAYIVARDARGRCYAVLHQLLGGNLGAADSWAAELSCRMAQVTGLAARLGPKEQLLPQQSFSLGAAAAMPQTWARRIEHALKSIDTGGSLKKIVLAHTETQLLKQPESLAVQIKRVSRALQAQHTQSTCYVVPTATGAFVGASPEVLIELRGSSLTTHAVAGTRACGSNAQLQKAAAAALLADPKERYEHALVATDLQAALALWSCNISYGAAPVAHRVGGLMHLVTQIDATVHGGTNLGEMVDRLHPTPALGGQSQAAARAYLREHEPFWRGLYGAPLGWMGLAGDAAVHVGIRSALMVPGCAHLYAGVGVVPASQAQSEWLELQLKLTPMRQALAAAAVQSR